MERDAAADFDWGLWAIALRLGAARGEINKEAFAWRFKKNLPFVAAPLVYEGVFYIVKDGGIITSLDPATGKVLKQGCG